MMYDLELTQDEAWKLVYVDPFNNVFWEQPLMINSWIEENLSDYCRLYRNNKTFKSSVTNFYNIFYSCVIIEFATESDMVAFKLRWL